MINIIFFATPKIALKSLEYLCNSDEVNVLAVVTQEDKPSGRGYKLTSPPVKLLAEELKLKVFQTNSVSKDENLKKILKEFQPDFLVTFAFGQMLSQEVLDIPKKGTVNLHASLLPKYRGANPIQRCLYNGDSETGITTMLTVLKMDAGDICLQERIQLTENITDVVLTNVISEKSPTLLEKTLVGLNNFEIIPIKQNENEVTFANKFAKTDAMIDFKESAGKFLHKVRAFTSYPNAYTIFNGKNLKILEAENLHEKSDYKTGQVVEIINQGIVICIVGEKILLKRVKPEGKSEMSARDWSNGAGIKSGDFLGENL